MVVQFWSFTEKMRGVFALRSGWHFRSTVMNTNASRIQCEECLACLGSVPNVSNQSKIKVGGIEGKIDMTSLAIAYKWSIQLNKSQQMPKCSSILRSVCRSLECFLSRVKRKHASGMFTRVWLANQRSRSVEGLHQQAQWIICTTMTLCLPSGVA